MRQAVFGLACCVIALLADTGVFASTAFCAAGHGQVLVGNNEDWHNPKSKLWFVPVKPGSYGRMYVGFDDLTPFGGMNEHGLWFDAFAAPPMGTGPSSALPSFSGEIVDTAMAECRTVEDVVRLFSRYNRNFLAEGILMFADASGDAVSIERHAMVRKTRGHFVQTNFHQSRSKGGPGKDRFDAATAMLEAAGEDVSIDLFRRILAATHQKGGARTLYSNIYDLRSRTMYLYYFHDFDQVVILGRPVIDETAIRGSYDVEFDWGTDRVPSVTATLRDRFGLRLSPDTRNLDTLIVDRVRREPALVLLAGIGRLTRGAPAQVRQRIADVLTVR